MTSLTALKRDNTAYSGFVGRTCKNEGVQANAFSVSLVGSPAHLRVMRTLGQLLGKRSVSDGEIILAYSILIMPIRLILGFSDLVIPRIQLYRILSP